MAFCNRIFVKFCIFDGQYTIGQLQFFNYFIKIIQMNQLEKSAKYYRSFGFCYNAIFSLKLCSRLNLELLVLQKKGGLKLKEFLSQIFPKLFCFSWISNLKQIKVTQGLMSLTGSGTCKVFVHQFSAHFSVFSLFSLLLLYSVLKLMLQFGKPYSPSPVLFHRLCRNFFLRTITFVNF